MSDSIGYLSNLMNPLTAQHFSFKCPMDWNAMEVSGSGRHCGKCQKHVYDLTNCSIDEVIALQKKNGPICGSISVAVVALSLATAACESPKSIQTTEERPSQQLTVPIEEPRIRGEICSPEELEKMKKQAPASTQASPTMGRICPPEQLEKIKRQAPPSAGE